MGFSGLLTTYVLVKRSMRNEVLVEKLEDIIDLVLADPDNKQRLYAIGYVLGAGIAAGTGFAGKGGRKLGTDDLISMGIQWFLGGKNKMIAPSEWQKPDQTSGEGFQLG